MDGKDGGKENISRNIERRTGKRIDLSRDQKSIEKARDQKPSSEVHQATEQGSRENPFKNVLKPPQKESGSKSNGDSSK